MDLPSRAGLTLDPPAADFITVPAAWYYFASIRELSRGPLVFELPGGQRFVGFLAANDQPVVLSPRCAHMGADLVNGCVRDGRLACPLHGWQFNSLGHCVHIPASPHEPPPLFARQTAYPTIERGGHVFFFNEPRARFRAPFFDGMQPSDLCAARAFDLHDNVPWYFIGANGFDVQHFLNAHDRALVGEPRVDAVDRFARRITLHLRVAGTSINDRLTRIFAGPELTMTVTVWGGTLIFVEARFRRTTSYGLMTVRPLERDATHCRVIVWVRRSRSALGRAAFDAANVEIRRLFIRHFLRSDLGRMSGVRYTPGRLLAIDASFRDYMEWLRHLR